MWPPLLVGTLAGTALLITLPIGAAVWWLTLIIARSAARLEVRSFLPLLQFSLPAVALFGEALEKRIIEMRLTEIGLIETEPIQQEIIGACHFNERLTRTDPHANAPPRSPPLLAPAPDISPHIPPHQGNHPHTCRTRQSVNIWVQICARVAHLARGWDHVFNCGYGRRRVF